MDSRLVEVDNRVAEEDNQLVADRSPVVEVGNLAVEGIRVVVGDNQLDLGHRKRTFLRLLKINGHIPEN